ncbi:hypothetical protein CEXT_87051 [Caerostris extrusa]|uniref:Uncharacterized protein n=1 Tax=Caerostris extrusa TaxID=172846 RepID=A0AAV4NV27_CAEEX|nr:hypothetical protein CEXT_87051 [Caerostris extrusa]
MKSSENQFLSSVALVLSGPNLLGSHAITEACDPLSPCTKQRSFSSSGGERMRWLRTKQLLERRADPLGGGERSSKKTFPKKRVEVKGWGIHF